MFWSGSCPGDGLTVSGDLTPRVEPQVEKEAVLVWRLPVHISQSRLGDRVIGSNACTIIAVKIAEVIQNVGIRFCAAVENEVEPQRTQTGDGSEKRARAAGGRSVGTLPALGKSPFGRRIIGRPWTKKTCDTWSEMGAEKEVWDGGTRIKDETTGCCYKSCKSPTRETPKTDLGRTSPWMVNAIANGIVEGNTVHEKAMHRLNRKPDQLNFTIPDALASCDNAFREMDFTSVRGSMKIGLEEQLSDFISGISYWEKSNGLFRRNPMSHLFFLLIAFERTVLVTFQPREGIFTLIDSHSHGKHEGAIFAVASYNRLSLFTHWILDSIFPECRALEKKGEPQEFEISMIRWVLDDCPPTILPDPYPRTTVPKGQGHMKTDTSSQRLRPIGPRPPLQSKDTNRPDLPVTRNSRNAGFTLKALPIEYKGQIFRSNETHPLLAQSCSGIRVHKRQLSSNAQEPRDENVVNGTLETGSEVAVKQGKFDVGTRSRLERSKESWMRPERERQKEPKSGRNWFSLGRRHKSQEEQRMPLVSITVSPQPCASTRTLSG